MRGGRDASACTSGSARGCAAKGIARREARAVGRVGTRIAARRGGALRFSFRAATPPSRLPPQIKRTWGTGKRETARAAKKAAAS